MLEFSMYHYDPSTALEELSEDATLPNPVHLRDMILRQSPEAGRVSRVESYVHRVPEVFRRDAEAGKADSERDLTKK